jgi:hypothetical protein
MNINIWLLLLNAKLLYWTSISIFQMNNVYFIYLFFSYYWFSNKINSSCIFEYISFNIKSKNENLTRFESISIDCYIFLDVIIDINVWPYITWTLYNLKFDTFYEHNEIWILKKSEVWSVVFCIWYIVECVKSMWS